MRIVRPVVDTVGGVGHRVRDLGRLQEVARVLIKHGLGLLVAGVEVPGIRRRNDALAVPTPERLVSLIQELGPTFVKLGQVLSSRGDLLSEAYITALEKLQDDVNPLEFTDIDACLTQELGPEWRSRFATFDELPLATASIAQVHRATLLDGRHAVLKVQRPGISRLIRADLSILALLARRALVEYPEAQSFDPIGVLQEFERSIIAEMDFENEVRNIRRIAANFAGQEDIIVIPEAHEDLSTRHVLTMDFLDGVKIRDARAAGHDMKLVGDRYLKIAYDMLFEHGFFHGDLHPGNVLVLPNDRLGLIDFGMVGSLTQEMRNNVISIIFAIQRGDYRTIARLFYDIAIKDDRVDFREVERATVEIMEKHWSGNSVREMQIGPYVTDLARAAARHGARIPSSYTMFFKAVITSEGLSKNLIEEVDPIAAAEPYIRRFLQAQLSEERLRQDFFYNFISLSSVGRRVPVALTQLMDDLEAQRLQIHVRDPDRADTLATRNRMQNRLIIAAFTITAVCCGTVALMAEVTWVFGIPVLSLIFYAAAAPMWILTLSMVLRNRG
jgi:ubiquinone biosynthesis protein